jgi:ketose-bisphosphate aldolase
VVEVATVPVVPTQEILGRAFKDRYGVAAINIVDALSIQAVLDAAVRVRAPVILQTSVKTVRSLGVGHLFSTWTALTAEVDVPVALHLDHCPDRQVISECLAAGWNSVLFDASSLPVAENQRQTVEVVAEARRFGAAVEGEIESITGVEDGVGSDSAAEQQTLDTALDFIRETGVDVFAPAIGNAHGIYRSAPVLDLQKVSDLVAAAGVPIALHGGSGMSDDQFRDLVSRGCAKVNISTTLKQTYMKSSLEFLKAAEAKDTWDPPSLFAAVHDAVADMAAHHMELFGGAGRAW